MFPDAHTALAAYAARATEVYYASREVVASHEFARLGLTDAAIIELARDGTMVLTTDHELYGRLTANGVTAENFIHARTPRL